MLAGARPAGYLMAWTRTILLKSTMLGSAVGVLIPLLVAELTRIENVALWLGARGAVQLLSALLPSPLHVLLQSQGGAIGKDQAAAIARAAPLYLLLMATGLFLLVLLFGSAVSGDTDLPGVPAALPLALYSAVLLFTVSSMAILRVVQRADLMLSISFRDLLLSLLCLPALYWGFSAFLLACAAKEVIRAAQVLPQFGRPALALPPWRAMVRGGSQYVRGLVQVASQYLERTAFPLLFGLKLAGQLGLGSTLGVLPVMLSSNMYLWAFRRIAEGDEQARSALIAEWGRLLSFGASLSWWLAALAGVADLGHYGSPDVAAAASFTAAMGVGFLATARSRAALLGLSSSFLHMGLLAAVYAAVAAAAAAGLDLPLALAAGIAVSSAYAVALALRMSPDLAKGLIVHAVVAAAAAAGFALYAEQSASFGNLACAAVAILLSAPYLLALVKKANR